MTTHKQLPPPERDRVSVGYLRLADSAPLILARESGLFTRYGLDVELVREVTWANLRDKLVVGKLDAAQMLAPLPMMTSYGAGGMRANMLTGLSMSLSGNAITLSGGLWERMNGSLGSVSGDTVIEPMETARGLAAVLKGSPGGLITLATVHAFSMHTFLLRLWLQAGGIDPDRDVRIIVLPPEQMCDSLARGIIDGFCVGEPWNTVAVQQGIGVVAAAGYHIWNNAPEKVLSVMESWHNQHPATHLRLRLAIMEASLQLRNPEHRARVAELLSQPDYLDMPVKALLPALSGEFVFSKNASPVAIPDFHVFSRYQAGFPWRSHAEWMIRQSSSLLGKAISSDDCRSLVQQCYRPDLYREAARYLGMAAPDCDIKSEGHHSEPWDLAPGITLGADLMVCGQTWEPSAG